MKYLLFDLDGTLTDPYEGITKSILYALSAVGIYDDDPQKLRNCIGPPLNYSFSEIYRLPPDRVPFAIRKYRERYGEVGLFENEPLPGALEALKAFKEAGMKMAVASSKPKPFVDRIVDKFGFAPYFDAVVGSGLDGKLNTKTLVMREAMRLLDAKADETVMIGDRKHDVLGAKECGVKCVGIETGYAEEGELAAAGADRIVKNFPELTKLLLSV